MRQLDNQNPRVNSGSIKVPKFYEPFVTWKQKSADLVAKDGKVFLHVVMEKDVEDRLPNGKVVGVDVGVKRTAVTSENRFFGGGVLSHSMLRYRTKRRSLQLAKDTSLESRARKTASPATCSIVSARTSSPASGLATWSRWRT